jgi:hypothetical protein
LARHQALERLGDQHDQLPADFAYAEAGHQAAAMTCRDFDRAGSSSRFFSTSRFLPPRLLLKSTRFFTAYEDFL